MALHLVIHSMQVAQRMRSWTYLASLGSQRNLELLVSAYVPVQALSAAIIAFAGLYLRSRYNIRPDAVYRKALVQLNTNPAILEVQLPLK